MIFYFIKGKGGEGEGKGEEYVYVFGVCQFVFCVGYVLVFYVWVEVRVVVWEKVMGSKD